MRYAGIVSPYSTTVVINGNTKFWTHVSYLLYDFKGLMKHSTHDPALHVICTTLEISVDITAAAERVEQSSPTQSTHE